MLLSQAKELIQKYREGTLTEPEKALLEAWYLDLAKSERQAIDPDDLERQLDEVWRSLPVNQEPPVEIPAKRRHLYRYFAVAASIVLCCTLGGYFFYNSRLKTPQKQIASQADAAPGGNKAILTLADGAEIVLDKMANGELARQGDITILKKNQGEIVYQTVKGGPGKAVHASYNTVVTPRAGQYKVILPDGTRAWLNAASSIRFPTAFPDQERVVEIMGEVYFEVAKVTRDHQRVPFKVLTGRQLVEVLGTRFNINSYADEGDIKTTLVEGSIKVHVAGNVRKGILLRPGQQSQLVAAGNANISGASAFDVKTVNAGAVVAWKNGFFRFDNVGLPELMRQLSRWYDMEVVYGSSVREHEFVGQIERTAPLSKVLKILEMGDVHFRVDGRKIVVTD